MKRILPIICFLICSATFAYADKVAINHFAVRENSFTQNEIAIVAIDTAGNTLENVNGKFSFSVNGFPEDLRFRNGIAFYKHKLGSSSFLYVKHENESGTYSALYYVYKTDSKLIPIHISWIILLAIPIILIVLGYMFKKFIIAAILIFIVFLYFTHHNGLSVPTFFESIIDGLKGLFH